jgi:hypothetical protein
VNSELHKGEVEVAVFRDFIEAACLPIDPASIQKRSGHSEPDILCTHRDDGLVAFELVEICDSSLAKAISSLKDGGVTFLYTANPSREIVRKKLKKTYAAPYPVELLCYTVGRVVTPDDVILDTICPWFDAAEGPFRRAWFLGETGAHVVWRAS